MFKEDVEVQCSCGRASERQAFASLQLTSCEQISFLQETRTTTLDHRQGLIHYARPLSIDILTRAIMFGILKFQTFLMVVLLFICSCTYLHGVFPAWLDRNKTGYGMSFSAVLM